MTILEDNGRADGRSQIIRSRIRKPVDYLVVLGLDQAVRQKGCVGKPLDKRAGHSVVGQHVGHGRRIGQMASKQPFDKCDHR